MFDQQVGRPQMQQQAIGRLFAMAAQFGHGVEAAISDLDLVAFDIAQAEILDRDMTGQAGIDDEQIIAQPAVE